jgi:hypothetical protein
MKLLETLRGKSGCYMLAHAPDQSRVLRATSDLARVALEWYSRLEHVDTMPRLSHALRAIYTKREDFRFVVIAQCDLATARRTARTYAHVAHQRSAELSLNMDKKEALQKYWFERIPEDRRPVFDEDGRLVPCPYTVAQRQREQ